MNEEFRSLGDAPRDQTLISGMSVAGNILDVKWMPDHVSTYRSAMLIPAGWCDALSLEPVELTGWRPIEVVNSPTDTVGKLIDHLATLPRELRIVIASDEEGNSFHFLADTGRERVWNNEERNPELVDVEDAKEEDDYTDEQIEAETTEVLVLWP